MFRFLSCQWNELHDELRATTRAIGELTTQVAALQDMFGQAVALHRTAVVAEPQSFLQPMLLEKWRETRADLFQTVRLFGLEVQELKDKTCQLFLLFVFMRRALLPLQADVLEALRTMNGHLENLNNNVDSLTTEEHGVYEAATQSVLAAFKKLEDRL